MIRVVLPWPDPRLAPNKAAGRDWRALAAIKSDAKGYAYVATKNAIQGDSDGSLGSGDVPITITFQFPDKRRRDTDGLLSAMKSSLDGVAQAIDIDDSKFSPVFLFREYGKKPGAVVVEIG